MTLTAPAYTDQAGDTASNVSRKVIEFAAHLMYTSTRRLTFDVDDLVAHCARWGVAADQSYFTVENNILYLHFCIEGDYITEEMLSNECMKYRMVVNEDNEELPLSEFEYISELREICVDCTYELRYIADA